MRRVIRSVALSVPFLLPVIAADAPSSQVLYTGKRQQPLPLSNVGDPAAVAKARLFVTVDNGKTWALAHELQIAEGTKELPKFPFSTDRDGTFGIMPCISYRSGQSEAEPKPGQVPPYVLVVDTAAPAIAQFDATLVGRSTAKAVVRFTWSVMDLNPEKEPIALEASTDGGARFITIHRGGLDGSVELTVPVGPETTELHLRLLATDRARNVTVSPSRNLSLAPMGEPAKSVAPVDPKEALAKAAATLPTLAEVGAGELKPLPTNTIAPPSQENPGAPVAPKSSGTPATTAAAVPATPAATPAPEAKPEVVVNGKAYVAPPATTTPEKSADVVVADNSVDQAYYEALAAKRPVAVPVNPKTAPRPVLPPTPVAAPAAPQPSGDGRRAAITRTPVLVDDEVKTLNDARVLATTGHLDDACDLYERLLFTSLGKTALLEQVRLLLADKRPLDALTAVSSAPGEVVSDQVRLDHGQLLLDLDRPAEVEGAVSGVGGNAPEARPALLLIAKAYLALGRDTEAKRALDWLARGKDAVAAEARTLTGR